MGETNSPSVAHDAIFLECQEKQSYIATFFEWEDNYYDCNCLHNLFLHSFYLYDTMG
jgi:hypothetical protein